MKVLATIRGVPVQLLDDGSVSFGPVGMTVDADGSPRAYGPRGWAALDYLANAGHPGNWWGVVTDRFGKPVVQGETAPSFSEETKGFYVSTTSYERKQFPWNDPRRFLNSETERFIVVPAFLRARVKPIVLGCRAEVIDVETRQTVPAIVGDFGPASHLGEASMAVAKAFRINADPKSGGTDERRFIYKVYPGQKADGYELLAAP